MDQPRRCPKDPKKQKRSGDARRELKCRPHLILGHRGDDARGAGHRLVPPQAIVPVRSPAGIREDAQLARGGPLGSQLRSLVRLPAEAKNEGVSRPAHS